MALACEVPPGVSSCGSGRARERGQTWSLEAGWLWGNGETLQVVLALEHPRVRLPFSLEVTVSLGTVPGGCLNVTASAEDRAPTVRVLTTKPTLAVKSGG